MTIELLATEEMQPMAQKIYKKLRDTDCEVNYSELQETVFANKEIKPKVPESIRQKDVYLMHSMHYPDPSAGLVRLMLSMDAISRASPKSLTLVLPYMTYTRQDRKDEPRVPISARMIANIVESYPVERIITMDLHCDQAQGFYNIPVDNLYGSLIHSDYFKEQYQGDYSNLVVVSPDHGGVTRARRFARSLDEDVPVYIIDKRRSGPNKVEIMNFIGGDIEDKDIVIYDDMIDSGGSILKAAELAYKRGANNVYAAVSHAIFSEKDIPAEQKFAESQLKVVATDTIPRSAEYYEQNKRWLIPLKVEDLFAKAIYESSKPGGSISKLFENN